ncbi:MAG: hypothetical protein ABI689_00460 [Thermoanaerobaculia bacterium]
MNDSLPPPQSKPFAPEKMRGDGGCQKPVLIGCGLLSLLLGIAAVVFVVKAKDVLAYAMNQLRVEIVAHLPEDAGATERQRLEVAFDAALARIRGGELDPAALQELQKKLTVAASASSARRLTREELDGLVAALDKFNQGGAKAPADAAAEPPEAGAGAAAAGDATEEPGHSAGAPAEPAAESARPPAP